MDYEFWLRVLPHYPLTFVDRVLVECQRGGISATDRDGFHREERIANSRHLPRPGSANLRAWLRPWWLLVRGE